MNENAVKVMHLEITDLKFVQKTLFYTQWSDAKKKIITNRS